VFGAGDGSVQVAVDGARLGRFPLTGAPRRVVLRTGTNQPTGANGQPALWDSVYVSRGFRIVEGVSATKLEQGALNTRLTRFGAEWSRVALRHTAAAAATGGQLAAASAYAAGNESTLEPDVVAQAEVSPGPRYAHAMAAAEEEGAAYLFGGELAGAGAGGGLWRLNTAHAEANAVGGYFATPEAKAFGTREYYAGGGSSGGGDGASASVNSSTSSDAPSLLPRPVQSPHWEHVRVVGVGEDGVPSPRRDATLVFLPPSGGGGGGEGGFGFGPRVMLHGGRISSGQPPLSDVWSFDLRAEVWTRLQDCPAALYGHTAVLHRSRVWVFGGHDGSTPNPCTSKPRTSSLKCYAPRPKSVYF